MRILFKKDFSRFSSINFRCTFKTKSSWKVQIFIITFKLIGFFSIRKQITILAITQNLFFALLKLIVNFFSVVPMVMLISSVGPWPNTNNYFKGYQMMNSYQYQKLQYWWQSHYQNARKNHHQMLFQSHYTHTLSLFPYINHIRQAIFFNMKLLRGFI